MLNEKGEELFAKIQDRFMSEWTEESQELYRDCKNRLDSFWKEVMDQRQAEQKAIDMILIPLWQAHEDIKKTDAIDADIAIRKKVFFDTKDELLNKYEEFCKKGTNEYMEFRQPLWDQYQNHSKALRFKYLAIIQNEYQKMLLVKAYTL